jgi:hypothetical protein
VAHLGKPARDPLPVSRMIEINGHVDVFYDGLAVPLLAFFFHLRDSPSGTSEHSAVYGQELFRLFHFLVGGFACNVHLTDQTAEIIHYRTSLFLKGGSSLYLIPRDAGIFGTRMCGAKFIEAFMGRLRMSSMQFPA